MSTLYATIVVHFRAESKGKRQKKRLRFLYAKENKSDKKVTE